MVGRLSQHHEWIKELRGDIMNVIVVPWGAVSGYPVWEDINVQGGNGSVPSGFVGGEGYCVQVISYSSD